MALVRAFVADIDVAVLNVAGPSEGRTPGSHAFVRAAMREFIQPVRS